MSRIEISKRLVLINSASSAVVLVLNLTVLIWLQQYLLKRISPDEYALLPLVMAVMAFSPLLTMVLTGGLGRYITVAYARGDDEEITRICSTMFPLLLAGGGAFLAIGWFAAWHIDSLLEINPDYLGDARLMMALLVFSTAIRLPLAIFSSGFLVRQKLVMQDMIDLVCQIFRIILLFALIFGFGAKVMWVTVTLVASELLNLVIATPISIRLVPAQRLRSGLFKSTLAKKLTSYGSWTFIGRCAETIKQAMDPIVLNRFATSMDVSVFYVAGIVPRQLTLILAPISRPFIPILAAFWGTGDRVRLANTYLRVARYQSWLLLFFVVPSVTFSHEIVYLYLGEKYESASMVMSILLIGTALSGFNALGGAIAAASGQVKEFALKTLLSQVANLLLTLLFIVLLHGGALGAACATLGALVLVDFTLVWPCSRKIVGVDTIVWLREVVFPCAVPTIVSASFCIFISRFLTIDSWILLLTASGVSGVVFLLVVLTFGLRVQDRLEISNLVATIPPPFGPLLQTFFSTRR